MNLTKKEIIKKLEKLKEEELEDEKKLANGEAVPLKGAFEKLELEAKLNGIEEAEQEFIKNLDKLEKEEGSRCVEGSILFSLKTWNKFKKKWKPKQKKS
jgi:hypothetical protein